jgi:hypothetical protein
VQHAFARPGPRTVTVTTRWFGEYGWAGSADFPIPGTPIELSASLPLEVRQARARLVPG